MFKLQVNIPDKLLADIDKVSAEKYLTRTSMVTLLLAEGIERYKFNQSVPELASQVSKVSSFLLDSDKVNKDSNEE